MRKLIDLQLTWTSWVGESHTGNSGRSGGRSDRMLLLVDGAGAVHSAGSHWSHVWYSRDYLREYMNARTGCYGRYIQEG